MLSVFLLAAEDNYIWPTLVLVLVATGAWDCYSGTTQWGRYLEYSKDDDPGPFIILVGLKFVAALLIAACILF